MLDLDKLSSCVGEHSFVFKGEAGPLEGVLTVPSDCNQRYIALLGHPHSLQGGTMSNKVVTTLARSFKELNIMSLRFNFRGVGQSQGIYDKGIGESEDMLALMRLCQQELPEAQFILAGFSFGSYVTYRVAAQSTAKLLLTVAPPVHHYDYREFKLACPWVIFQGEADEVVPLAVVLDFLNESNSNIPLIRFADTGHFFHGKLIELREELMTQISKQV